MAETYVGEIRIFAGNYAPEYWALCNGQLLAINEYEELFSLIGTSYGGNGTTNFALPDLRGRIAICMGAGPALTPRYIGQKYGSEQAILNPIPEHSHHFMGTTDDANSNNPSNKVLAKLTGAKYYEETDGDEDIVPLNPETVSYQGGSKSHYNMMPSLCMNYIISLRGIYPPRP